MLKTRWKTWIGLAMLAVGCAVLAAGWLGSRAERKDPLNFPEMTRAEAKKARDEYFRRILADPATGRIPDGIRRRELAHARTIPRRDALSPRGAGAPVYDWEELGPVDVGGRTRALAIDVTDPDTLLAGGVSGGMWKSEDGGRSWRMVSDPGLNPSVTAVAQDPRPGFTHIWYYATGELSGNSANDRGQTAFFDGSGIFKSVDGGESWSLLDSTASVFPGFIETLDSVVSLAVNPLTGTLYAGAAFRGLFRSADQGASFQRVGLSEFSRAWTQVAIGSDGRIVAGQSRAFAREDQPPPPVLFLSRDDGASWRAIDPPGFPEETNRTMIAFAPSDLDILYVYALGQPVRDPETRDQIVHFWRIDLSTMAGEDRSENLPDFDLDLGRIDAQSGYDMALAVKPDNPDFVLLGGRNLWRSDDGFATALPQSDDPSVAIRYWIGGYDLGRIAPYRFHHPDQHALAFDPRDPNRLFSANDGGVYVTENLLARRVFWQDLNTGYNVTQFYTVALPPGSGDMRVMGGTQDNGTPFMRSIGGLATPSQDVTFADGAYAFFGDRTAYTSRQRGRIIRSPYDEFGRPDLFGGAFFTFPPQREHAFFIHPYAVNPLNENQILVPDGGRLWRHLETERIPELFEMEVEGLGWQLAESAAMPEPLWISALAYSAQADRLYYGGSSFIELDEEVFPKLFRLDGPFGEPALPVDISPDLPLLAFIHNITFNPEDPDELLVVISNYRTESLFHSTDAGDSFTAVEGNLSDDPSLPTGNDGPSLRWSAILPTAQGTRYFVGGSTGLYSTDRLLGSETLWVREGASDLGYSVVAGLAARPSDGVVAAGTHGRGIFIGRPASEAAAPSQLSGEVLPLFEHEGERSASLVLTNLGLQPDESVFQAWGEDGRRAIAPALFEVEEGFQQIVSSSSLFRRPSSALSRSRGWFQSASLRGGVLALGLQEAESDFEIVAPVRKAAKKLYFTRALQGRVFRGRRLSTRLHLVNPFDETVEAELLLHTTGLKDQDTFTAAIPPKGVFIDSLRRIFGTTRVTGGFLEATVLQGPGIVGYQTLEFTDGGALAGAPGRPAAPSQRLFAPWSTLGPEAFTELQLVNLSESAQSVTLSLVAEDGSLAASADFDLLSKDWTRVGVRQVLGGVDLLSGTLVLDAPLGQVAADLFIGGREQLLSATLVPFCEARRSSLVPHFADTNALSSFLAVFNPAQEPARVRLGIVDAFQTEILRREPIDLTLSAGARVQIELSRDPVILAGGYVAATSDLPVAVAAFITGPDGLANIPTLELP